MVMIDTETRKKIEVELGEQPQKDIDTYFKECYRVVGDGVDYIVVTPLEPDKELTMMFNEETGEFAGLEMWSYAQETGELL